MTKKLFVLLSNGGDGSAYPRFTFSQEYIDKLQEDYDNGDCDYEFGLGIDGDGFHYETLTVPDECTLESLGIHSDAASRG